MGLAIGAALTGLRPVVEIMFNDFVTCAMDQIVNQAAKIKYMFGGKPKLPLVIRMPAGAGMNAGPQHSQSLEAWFTHIPGLKVIMPSTVYDAKGLLKSAIRDDNPIIFIENKILYSLKGDVPEGDYTIPIGVGEIKREGRDVTIVATSQMVHKALKAAQTLSAEKIEAEVIDPRTLSPLDKNLIIDSVKKTGRLVIAYEAVKFCGYGAEIAAIVSEEAFRFLKAPIKRVAAPFTPVPFSKPLEQFYLPKDTDIIQAVKEIMTN
ncbi:MAG: acetoin dehydrogenase [Candidatus Schekmanbacteria bacterium RBG_16_38_11]|uniref:Acetoin dehydrogenase n=1 Tax=Candidatus Schekmanbacteria bacterium RBG_16_38_11 TaxID=1817880 RepID=A0A1F7RVM4_9BACT|nr:MAG: acetoin dehydrogenase [Candidatus Schekmanbacteria bacterium RBG_16_38_11]